MQHFIHHQAFKFVIEKDLIEQQAYREKIDLLEEENKWLKSKNSKKSKPNAYEVYVMTLEGQLSSLHEDNKNLKSSIETKDKLITELKNSTVSTDASSSELVEKLMALEESYQSVLAKLQLITTEVGTYPFTVILHLRGYVHVTCHSMEPVFISTCSCKQIKCNQFIWCCH